MTLRNVKSKTYFLIGGAVLHKRFPSVSLPFADHEFAFEVFVSYWPGFFLDPTFNPHFLDSAEIVDFRVVRIVSSLFSRWSEK